MVGGFVIGFLFLGLCFSGLAGRFSFVWGWYNIRFTVVWVGLGMCGCISGFPGVMVFWTGFWWVRCMWLYFWISWAPFLVWVW